jgi:hypothetical protein
MLSRQKIVQRIRPFKFFIKKIHLRSVAGGELRRLLKGSFSPQLPESIYGAQTQVLSDCRCVCLYVLFNLYLLALLPPAVTRLGTCGCSWRTRYAAWRTWARDQFRGTNSSVFARSSYFLLKYLAPPIWPCSLTFAICKYLPRNRLENGGGVKKQLSMFHNVCMQHYEKKLHWHCGYATRT